MNNHNDIGLKQADRYESFFTIIEAGIRDGKSCACKYVVGFLKIETVLVQVFLPLLFVRRDAQTLLYI